MSLVSAGAAGGATVAAASWGRASVTGVPGTFFRALAVTDVATTHNDLYDKEQYVTPTIAKLIEFYSANLAQPAVA